MISLFLCVLLIGVTTGFRGNIYTSTRTNLYNGYQQFGALSSLHPARVPSKMLLAASNVNYPQSGKVPTDVLIESPSMNTRRITASIIIEAPIECAWGILTDYNRLSTHVPNLVQSYLIPMPDKRIRLFQEGAQKIIGFDFRASLTMDMTEINEDETRANKSRQVAFKLVESQMFTNFDGTWTMKYHSRSKVFDPVTKSYTFRHNTKLTYSVFVQPRGPVPVFALEWRIKEDVPPNLIAVKAAAEKLYNAQLQQGVAGSASSGGESGGSGGGGTRQTEWDADETLGLYMGRKSKLSNEAGARQTVLNKYRSYDINF